jgi:hypothetical protein
MNWDKFDIHLENLIPGLTLTTILVFYWPDIFNLSDVNKTLTAAGIIASSYLAGAVANILARILLAPVAPWLLRVPFI